MFEKIQLSPQPSLDGKVPDQTGSFPPSGVGYKYGYAKDGRYPCKHTDHSHADYDAKLDQQNIFHRCKKQENQDQMEQFNALISSSSLSMGVHRTS